MIILGGGAKPSRAHFANRRVPATLMQPFAIPVEFFVWRFLEISLDCLLNLVAWRAKRISSTLGSFLDLTFHARQL